MTFAELLQIALTDASGNSDFTPETVLRLERLGAFAGKPALRFIINTAIKNGTLARFASFNEWNEESRGCVERFIAHTGFQPRLAGGIFESYAYCLGWSESIIPASVGQAAVRDVSEPDRLAELNDHLTVDREKEPYRGVTVDSPCITALTGRGLRITATLRRTQPLSSATLNYALRSTAGAVLGCGICATMTAVAPSHLPVSADIQCDVSQIGSVGLFIS